MTLGDLIQTWLENPWLEKPGGGGTGRDLPLRAPLVSLPGWDLGGGPIYNENGPFLLLLDCFPEITLVVGIGGFGPFETLEDAFPRGGGGPGPSPPISGIIYPALGETRGTGSVIQWL